MAAKAVVPFLVAMMLLTGVCNTILNKYQDMQCVRNCDSPDPKLREGFRQPVLQTLQMFIGEMMCWVVTGIYSLVVYIQNKRSSAALLEPTEHDALLGDDTTTLAEEDPLVSSFVLHPEGRLPLNGWKIVYLALPAICDITGTTMMNIGLLLVAASIYQMTRGALVLFVGLFSVWFLKRHLSLYKWLALVIVVGGIALVGLAGAIEKAPEAPPSVFNIIFKREEEAPGASNAFVTLLGVFLIAAAQIFTATQFVLEESIMEKYALEPLKAVGWEGVWGFLITLIAMIIAHFTYGVTEAGRHGYFDAADGLSQMLGNKAILISSILIMISIGGFNFFGLSVTRTVSATSRSTIDTCRTLFIWMVSLGLGWESFKWLQVAGFALLVYGTFLFNDLVKPPLRACLPAEEEHDEEEEDI